jgi:hypothetical protein
MSKTHYKHSFTHYASLNKYIYGATTTHSKNNISSPLATPPNKDFDLSKETHQSLPLFKRTSFETGSIDFYL